MTDPDPYLTLGVPRTASRDEIARAFRTLAKRHHPDAGPRRARRWRGSTRHGTRSRTPSVALNGTGAEGGEAFAAPHWTAAPPIPDPPPAPHPGPPPSARASRLDSGWAAAAIVAGVAVVVGLVMVGIALATQPADDRVALETPALTLLHEPDWVLSVGDGDDPPQHRVVAHLATWSVDRTLLCTTYGEVCGIEASAIPPGEALILITSHEGGEPPVADPVRSLPYGLDADAMIGGAPAAYDFTQVEPGIDLAWWQLSPPGFPDEWIEVRALIRATDPARESEMLAEIQAMLGTLEFEGRSS